MIREGGGPRLILPRSIRSYKYEFLTVPKLDDLTSDLSILPVIHSTSHKLHSINYWVRNFHLFPALAGIHGLREEFPKYKARCESSERGPRGSIVER